MAIHYAVSRLCSDVFGDPWAVEEWLAERVWNTTAAEAVMRFRGCCQGVETDRGCRSLVRYPRFVRLNPVLDKLTLLANVKKISKIVAVMGRCGIQLMLCSNPAHIRRCSKPIFSASHASPTRSLHLSISQLYLNLLRPNLPQASRSRRKAIIAIAPAR